MLTKGPFIFYELGGGGLVGLRGGRHANKLALKGGGRPKKYCPQGRVTPKFTLKYCNYSIYDGAKFSTKIP